MGPPHFLLGTVRGTSHMTKKLNKFADLYRNLDGLELADLASTNEACGATLLALRKLPKLWVLQSYVFERDVQKLITGAVDSLSWPTAQAFSLLLPAGLPHAGTLHMARSQ